MWIALGEVDPAERHPLLALANKRLHQSKAALDKCARAIAAKVQCFLVLADKRLCQNKAALAAVELCCHKFDKRARAIAANALANKKLRQEAAERAAAMAMEVLAEDKATNERVILQQVPLTPPSSAFGQNALSALLLLMPFWPRLRTRKPRTQAWLCC